ncbi:hypothetical protein INT43_006028 [Umbelopsis isabellina]|uniref:DUF726-domain-containing protein n=1 Tax=Mortierella isabellina TaxID=91625 RepID=A0A8H7U7X0_MORIS|nr:hypothetical protein INT43_006028 [Umbelopsis isabellina]
MQQDIASNHSEKEVTEDPIVSTGDQLATSGLNEANVDEMNAFENEKRHSMKEALPSDLNDDLDMAKDDNVARISSEHDDGSSVLPLSEPTHSLTKSSLATQNDLIPPSHTSVLQWASALPTIERPEGASPPPSPQFTPSHIFEISPQEDYDEEGDHRIQETKDVFTETQKIAYVGLCAVTSLEVVHECQGKDFAYARMSAGNWQRKVIRGLYGHMDISQEEITMIESLDKHNILPTDLVHQFTSQGETTTVPVGPMHKVNLDSDAQKDVVDKAPKTSETENDEDEEVDKIDEKHIEELRTELDNVLNRISSPDIEQDTEDAGIVDDSKVPQSEATDTSTHAHNGLGYVSTDDDGDEDVDSEKAELSSQSSGSSTKTVGALDDPSQSKNADKTKENANNIDVLMEEGKPQELVVDLRWTVVCDLIILCLSMNNYDSRSRVFIRKIATYLSLDWHEVIAFERRITEYLASTDPSWETESEMSFATTATDDTATSEYTTVTRHDDTVRKSRNKQHKKRRYIMMGLATLGGGLVLGLSAGLMAPVIAGGLGAVLTTVGVTGTSSFLGGTAGIALITSGATVAGGRIGAKRMFNRTRGVETFEFVTIKAEERVNCIISITGWLTRPDDKEEAGLPFSTLDSLMGDHYTLFWEPELLTELGSAIKIIATEVVTQAIQQALQHTIMGALLAGLTWPLALTKIGYLIDNPWANALDRARVAGLILADSLMNRSMGSRPVTLVGFSLGARVIFFCLLELSRMHAFGLVEDVAIFGTPVSTSMSQWKECTTVVAGRFINGYATNDWLLGFLFRASTGALGSVAGLRPLRDVGVQNVQNMDCTDLIKGHLHYKSAMPKLLKRAGFMVTSEELPEVKEKERPSGVMGLVGFGRSSLTVNDNDSRERSSSNASRASTPSIETDTPPRAASEMDGTIVEKDLEEKETKSTTQQFLNRAKATSLSSFSSGKASITLPNRKPSPSPDVISNVQPSHPPSPIINMRSASSPIPSRDLELLPATSDNHHEQKPTDSEAVPMYRSKSDVTSDSNIYQQPPLESRPSLASLSTEQSDLDLIAGIIANATAAASSKTGSYSSLSSGKASVVPRPSISTSTSTQSITKSPSAEKRAFRDLFGNGGSRAKPSPTLSNSSKDTKQDSASSSFFGKGLFGKRKEDVSDPSQQELAEAGVEVKELKSTLGTMVVPHQVSNPVPKVTLEMPKHARLG